MIRILLVGGRIKDRTEMEARLSIDGRVAIETVEDTAGAASLVEWRSYSLVVVSLSGANRSLVELINILSEQSCNSCIAFFGGHSSAMVKAAEMIARARGLRSLGSLTIGSSDGGDSEFRNFVDQTALGTRATSDHQCP